MATSTIDRNVGTTRTLVDLPAFPAPVARTKARRSRARRRITMAAVEGLLILVVAALFVVYVGAGLGQRFVRPQQSPVITVKVQPGDTLWTLAQRYGYPDDYILKRVDHLAAFNHLDHGARLQPGDIIRVPVENPAEQNKMVASK